MRASLASPWNDNLNISLRDSNRDADLCEHILTIDGGATRILLNLWDMTLTAMHPSRKAMHRLRKFKQPAVVVSVTPSWAGTSHEISGSHNPETTTLEGTVVVIEPALNPHTRAAMDRFSASDGSATAQIN
jgi:hypothetical protein